MTSRLYEFGIQQPLDKTVHERRPLNYFLLVGGEENIYLELGKPVVSESQIGLVEPQALAINLSTVCASVTIRTKGNEIFVLMLPTFSPRDYVMEIDLDVATSRDGTSMTSLDQYSPLEVGWYWWATWSGRHETALLSAGIKELTERVAKLEQDLFNLKNQVTRLERQI